ncbi:MAG: gamma-glutamyl-gamma-aminobutyrate hydrolase family protein [Pseudomonadota bacterium]
MRIHYLKHIDVEGVGHIGHWVNLHHHQLSVTRTFLGETLPPIAEIDLLLVMGGPQSATCLDKYPYLYQEIDYIQQAIAADKPVLGICLGMQLIAAAFGMKVIESPQPEIGTFPITLTSNGKKDPIFQHFPESFEVIQWHYDMVKLPEGVESLAYSAACPQQIVRFAKHVYGIQFHLEFTSVTVKRLMDMFIAEHKHKPGEAPYRDNYIATEDELMAIDFEPINQRMELLLDLLTPQGAKSA